MAGCSEKPLGTCRHGVLKSFRSLSSSNTCLPPSIATVAGVRTFPTLGSPAKRGVECGPPLFPCLRASYESGAWHRHLCWRDRLPVSPHSKVPAPNSEKGKSGSVASQPSLSHEACCTLKCLPTCTYSRIRPPTVSTYFPRVLYILHKAIA